MSRSRLVFLLLLFVSHPLAAQTPTPTPAAPRATLDADVVVSAEAVPRPAETLAVAATVIGEEEIERSRTTTLLELLRTVPGLDVVQSGGPGKVASLFMRGTTSTQTLVLVDGVRLNNPYFGAVDLAGVSTANVERVEIVRGPFSALYGSEAVGGVIQILTKRGSAAESGLDARGWFAAGSKSARDGMAQVAVSQGAIDMTAGFRRTLTDGDLPNDFFAGTTWSASLGLRATDGVRAGIVFRREDSKTGVPFSGSTPTPYQTNTDEATTVSLPLRFELSSRTAIEAVARWQTDHFTSSDPLASFFTFSDTDSSRAGGRLALSTSLPWQSLSAGVDTERTKVTADSSFGVALDGSTTHTWSLFAEDRISFPGDAVVATLGVRRDDHSAFGSAVSPRGTISWRVLEPLKLRASVGRAFRAPTTGELYYPFSGNPDLQPEKSNGYEGGAEWTIFPALVAEATYFRNDIRNLIVYDGQTGMNQSVGRARTEGLETVLRTTLRAAWFARASYTYLKATDLDANQPLVRRPAHRASVTVGRTYERGASWDITGIFVGRRADRDFLDFSKAVESPSYFRLDASLTLPPFFHLAPFARVTNVLDRRYQEVNGYDAPRRRFLAGLEAAF
jgi:vitamin B12 transporter